MTGELWLYGALVVAAVLNLLAVLFTAGRAGQATGDGEAAPAEGATATATPDVDTPDAGGGPGADEADLVACPSCEALNERDYRYCRACVSELPGGGVGNGAGAPARSGNVL